MRKRAAQQGEFVALRVGEHTPALVSALPDVGRAGSGG